MNPHPNPLPFCGKGEGDFSSRHVLFGGIFMKTLSIVATRERGG
jgi:hypothetical protein